MVKSPSSFILSLMLLAQPAVATETCQDLFSDKTPKVKKEELKKSVPSPLFESTLTNIEQIHEQMKTLSELKNKKISWENFYLIDELLKTVKKLPVSDKEQLKSLFAESKYSPFAEILKQQPSHRTLLDTHYNYFRLLNEINDHLNFKLFPDFGLRQVKTNEQTVEIATRIISDLSKKYEDNFSALGHENLEEFRTYAENYSPESKWVLGNLKEHTQVVLHRPEQARFWIPLTGFQNQRTTGSSKGFYLDGSEFRNKAESSLLALDLDAYKTMSVRTMPNYAELRYDFRQVSTKPHEGAIFYGNDLWVIKKEVLNKRATLTPMDSLGAAEKTYNITSKSFIPWKFRELLTPLLTNRNVSNVLNSDNGFNRKPEDFILKTNWEAFYSYVEVQIFGSLTLDDVQAFHFKQFPPDLELYKLLRSKNIEVFDERQWPPVKWEPNEK